MERILLTPDISISVTKNSRVLDFRFCICLKYKVQRYVSHILVNIWNCDPSTWTFKLSGSITIHLELSGWVRVRVRVRVGWARGLGCWGWACGEMKKYKPVHHTWFWLCISFTELFPTAMLPYLSTLIAPGVSVVYIYIYIYGHNSVSFSARAPIYSSNCSSWYCASSVVQLNFDIPSRSKVIFAWIWRPFWENLNYPT